LVNFVKNEFYWVWIFDQCNALCEHSVLNEYPFILINSLSRILGDAGFIIVSETSNNEICQFKSWNKLQLFDGYNDDEFNQWCTLYDYKDKAQLNDIKYWTSVYPLELDIWHKTPAKILQEKTKNYLENRESDIVKDYQIYRENLPKMRKENLDQCVTSMILQTNPPANVDGMDRQFMHIGIVSFQDEDEGEDKKVIKKTVVANYPFIRLAIFHAHGKGIINNLKESTSRILRGDEFTNKTKGKIVSLYIISILDLVRVFEFKCW